MSAKSLLFALNYFRIVIRLIASYWSAKTHE